MNRIRWVLVLWLVLAMFTVLQLVAVEYSGLYDYNLKDYLLTPGASLVTGIVLLFVFVIPIFDFSSKLNAFQRIVLLGFSGIFYSIVFILIMHLFPIVFAENPSDYKESIFSFSVASFHNVIKNYIFQMAILYAYEYINKEKLLFNKQKNLEIELNNTKLQILKIQLQPHFLFNAMNSVVAEIDEDKSKAQEMLINLSDILRTSLNTDFLTPVSLQEEIELIEKYLSIEKIRYDEQLNYEIRIDEKMKDKKIPSMILQPLAENAIKHGFKELQNPLTIIIEAGNNVITIKNNGHYLDCETHQIGLNNVSQRMELFSGNTDSFKIYQDRNWVINKIFLK